MKRLPPKQEVIRRLFALSGNQCAFPDCENVLVDETGNYIGQICHIEAALTGGERYNPMQTEEDRRSFENLIMLCYQHHVETNDVYKYTAKILKNIKAQHEEKFKTKQLKYSREVIVAAQQKLIAELRSISKRLDTIETGVVDVRTDAKAILSAFDQLNLQLASNNDIYSKQLDFLKGLKGEQKPQTAYEALLRFKDDNWLTIHAELKYKIIANIALCLLDLGENIDAGKWFVELKHIAFESKDSLAYLCIGYALTGNFRAFDITFEKAIKLGSDNVNLWIAYLQRHKENIDNAISKLPENVAEHNTVQFQIADLLLKKGRVNEGIEIAEKCIGANVSLATKWNIQATVASHRLMNVLPSLNQIAVLTPYDIEKITWANEKLSESWDFIKDSEIADKWWYILLNRGLSRKLLQDNIGAQADLEEAWRLNKNFSTFRNILAQYITTSKYSQADQLLLSENDLKLTSEQQLEVCKLKVNFYMLSERLDKAIDELDRFSESCNVPVDFLFLSFQVHFQLSDFKKAQEIFEKLSTDFPIATETYLAGGILMRKAGRNSEAKDEFEKSLINIDKCANANGRIYYIANEFYALGEFSQAAKLYERIVNIDVYDELFKSLLLSYFHSANYDQAELLIGNIKSKISPNPTVTEIEVNIFRLKGEFIQALSTINSFLEVAPENCRNYFRLLGAKLGRSRDEVTITKKYLDQIDSLADFATEEYFVISNLLIYCGDLDAAKKVAYTAWVKDYQLAYAHQNFVALWMEVKEDDQLLFPSDVMVDTVVELYGEGGDSFSFLITDELPAPGIDSVASTDALAKQVLGKSKGDRIELTNRIGKGSTRVINSIMTKYVYAFRESLRLLGFKFSEESGVVIINVDEDYNFKELNDFILKNSVESKRLYSQVMSGYVDGPCPLGFVSKCLKKNYVEVWLGMLGTSDAFIKSHTQDERSEIQVAFLQSKRIVLDLSALLTSFFLLDDLNLLLKLEAQFILSESAFTELLLFKETIERKDAGDYSVGVFDGRLILHEFTSANLERLNKQVNDIINWCKTNTAIMFPRTKISSDPARKEDYSIYIGKASHETLLLAQESNGVLFSDDQNLKSICRGHFGDFAFSTYQLCDHLLEIGTITETNFDEVKAILIRSNYSFIPVDPILLYKMFDESGFKIAFPFKNACRGLLILRADLAARITVEFAKKVFLNTGLSLTRTQVMMFVFQVLKHRRDYDVLKQIMVILFDDYFSLMPSQKTEVLSVLNSLSYQRATTNAH